MTTHWPAVGSQWKRVVDHGVQDKKRVDYPEPHAIEYLIVDKVDPGEFLGRQIQGRITTMAHIHENGDVQTANEWSHPYTTSHIIFWEVWVLANPSSASDYAKQFKREEESDGES